jgi:hypothetical protein
MSSSGAARREGVLRRIVVLTAPCRKRANLRRTTRIALVVGTILTLINQADVLLRGDATLLTAVKIPLNYVVPFIVSNLGVISGARTERDDVAAIVPNR